MVKWFTKGRSLRLVGMVGLTGLIALLSLGAAVGNPGLEGKVLRVREYMVSMRDGVRLWTKIFLPVGLSNYGGPVIMERTPYRFPEVGGDAVYEKLATILNQWGYVYVLQDCRGVGDSEGRFEPYRHEISDGQDTTTWIVKQPWSNGIVGTIGGSYTGFTAIAAAVNNPAIRAVFADDAPEDERYALRGGVLFLRVLDWRYAVHNNEQEMPSDMFKEMTNALDLVRIDDEVLGFSDPSWDGMVAAGDPIDSFWDDRTLVNQYNGICAPVLLVYSTEIRWHDPLKIWRGLREAGCGEHRENFRLVITPEFHGYHYMSLLLQKDTPVTQLARDYFDKYLQMKHIDLSGVPPVQFRAPTETTYLGSSTWPPPETIETVFYLSNEGGSVYDGKLTVLPPGPEAEDNLFFNPESMDPCAYEDFPMAVYTSDPLAEPIYLAGTPRVYLHISASTPDADLFAYLYKYNETNRQPYTQLGWGGQRVRFRLGFDEPVFLNPEEVVEVSIDLYPIAHEVRAGDSLVLFLAPGDCLYAENPHTGEPLANQTHWQSSTLSIFHDDVHRSRLVLPKMK